MALDRKVKSKWVRALRSGKYRRAKYQLKDQGAYCCLGVLCEVLKQPYGEDQAALGVGFRKRIGLTSEAESALVGLNDGDWATTETERFGKPPKGYGSNGASFKVIADWIIKHA